MKVINLLLLPIINTIGVSSLSCNEVLDLPEDKKLSLLELQTIPPKEIIQCLPHLGKDQIGLQEADYIWQTVIKEHDGIANIPDKVLMLLHWVTPAVTPEEYANLTLDNIDVIWNFGLNYNLDDERLAALADRVREDYAGKQPEDYTYYDLTAIRQILCAFNRSEIERIHPSVYRESALMIGKLQNCNPDVMGGFATLAVQNTAFGDPRGWAPSTVKIIGGVAEYLHKSIIQELRNTTKLQ